MKTTFSLFNRVCSQSPLYSNVRKLKLKRCFCVSSDRDKTDAPREQDDPRLRKLLDDSALGIGPLDETSEEDEWHSTAYPKGAFINPAQSQALKSLRPPNIDPRETSVILFPGQGSQYVGMGKELLQFPAARDVFDAASAILQYDIVKLMLNGPQHKLDSTRYCQPAVVVCSLAALEKLKEERPSAIENCVATAGFSVGEITALTFAGVFKFGDAIKLVRARAEAMELASELAPGGMATVMYGPNSELRQAMVKAKEWCLDRGIDSPECQIATYLNPNMKVIAGHTEALRYIECNKTFFKLDDVRKLPVKGAFHSTLMLPAVGRFYRKLENVELNEPLISVHSNVNGQYYKDEKEVLRLLPKQIYKPVKWEQMLHILYERDPDTNFPETCICGPMNSLGEYLHSVNAKAAKYIVNALDFIHSHSSEFKLRKVMRVPVSGAFHTNLMKPAVETFGEILKTIEMSEPSAHVYSNVDGKRYRTLEKVRKMLPKQIYKPVLWEQSLHYIYNRDKDVDVPLTYVCGPKASSLKTILQQVNRKAAACCHSILA